MQLRGDDGNASRVDPIQEINRLRHSVSLLETYILANSRPGSILHNPLKRPLDPPSAVTLPVIKKEPDEKENAPGSLGSQGPGGFYTGATSAATHLTLTDSRQSDGTPDPPQPDSVDDLPAPTEWDQDLYTTFPHPNITDQLISYYFEYCNWIYRHVNQTSFLQAWNRYKNGTNDRLAIATAFLILAVAVNYLPPDHHLLTSITRTPGEDLGRKYYDAMKVALERHRAENKTYSLDLVECLLIRCHFLTLSKTDSEEIWSVRGELVSIGMAMGLHRDPKKWRMSIELAERRRWAWWHIVLLERWQAFMFGRPISFASHHFDTHLPAPSDPTNPSEPRLYSPNHALFRLAYILGDIMDNAVSLREISYENVLENDRALTQWLEELPHELDLDEYRIARSLASTHTATRRIGVQSVIIRTSYYHIRFTLHRPYASSVPMRPLKGKDKDAAKEADAAKAERHAKSLEIAVGAADKLIALVGHARPDFLANASLAVPGHMNWGPFHVFSAAMFFSFQLISSPEQPGATLFRANIQKAVETLELSIGTPVADKALAILKELSPLYNPDFAKEPPQQQEKHKAAVLSMVKTLAFPYHDNPRFPRVHSMDSPAGPYATSSPSTGNSGSPQGVSGPLGVDHHSAQYPLRGAAGMVQSASYSATQYGSVATHLPTSQSMPSSASASSATYTASHSQQSGIYQDAGRQYAEPLRQSYSEVPTPGSSTYAESVRNPYPASDQSSYMDPGRYSSVGPSSARMSYDGNYRNQYMFPPAAEVDTMWGPSVSASEWTQLMEFPTGRHGERPAQ